MPNPYKNAHWRPLPLRQSLYLLILLSCHRSSKWVLLSMSLVHRHRFSCHGQPADQPTGYRPNTILAIIATVVFANAGAALSYRVVKSRAWWGSCLPIGSFCKSNLASHFLARIKHFLAFGLVVTLGFLLRYLGKYSPNNLTLFALEELFIICFPASFLAFNYITYGHLISYIGAEHSIINPRRVATIFVISDICTFFLQVRVVLYRWPYHRY